MLIVQTTSFLGDGDGYYREQMPARALARMPEVTFIDCHAQHRFADRLSLLADVLIFLPMRHYEIFSLLDERRKQGRASVFETNDYYPDLPPWSLIRHHWHDPENKGLHIEMLKAADAIQTSTPRIADHWKLYARKSLVFPNQIDTPPPFDDKPRRPLVTGWGGSQGHLGDFREIARELEPWLEAHSDIHFSVMGGEFVFESMRLSQSRYSYRPPGSIDDYLEFVRGLHIGIAPLMPTEFNMCRSDAKYLEFASLGVAGLYASPGPYDGVVKHGVNGFLCHSPQEFIHYLELLAGDDALRVQIARAAYDHVTKERLIDLHAGKRLESYRSLLQAVPRESLPAEWLKEASEETPGYFVLKLDELSEQFLALFPERGSLETLKKTEAILIEDPDWVNAIVLYGRFLNDTKLPNYAVEHLNRALELAPWSSSARCELGRAKLLLNDLEGARSEIEKALSMNPLFHPGWQYLIRLNRILKKESGRKIIRSLEDNIPFSPQLFFEAADLLDGDEGCEFLITRLDDYKTRFNPEELKVISRYAAPVIAARYARDPGSSSASRLVEEAARVFPGSARLAGLNAEILWRKGHMREAVAEYERALGIYEHWRSYSGEFSDEDRTHLLWLMGPHFKTRDTEKGS